jgi:hypothetical protein
MPENGTKLFAITALFWRFRRLSAAHAVVDLTWRGWRADHHDGERRESETEAERAQILPMIEQ